MKNDMQGSTISHLVYDPNVPNTGLYSLPEEESRHIAQVLRKQIGDVLHITDGKGSLISAQIVEVLKRSVVLQIDTCIMQPMHPHIGIHIAISPLKMMDRFEWFLEKAVEIGVSSITPIITKRTERTVLKTERLEKIIVAALKQSQRFYLPTLHTLTPFAQYLKSVTPLESAKMLAWCAEDGQANLPKAQIILPTHIMIGPEGDFTPEEAAQAKAVGFVPISLGDYRLRTETAGVVALTLLNMTHE
jgi:16S rRNA (uracil1498-N3)-methyltransferase